MFPLAVVHAAGFDSISEIFKILTELPRNSDSCVLFGLAIKFQRS